MDYTSAPVQASSGSQPTASGLNSAGSATGSVAGFNGLLQNAAAAPANTSTAGTSNSSDAGSVNGGANTRHSKLANGSASSHLSASETTSSRGRGAVNAPEPVPHVPGNPLAIGSLQNIDETMLSSVMVGSDDMSADGLQTAAAVSALQTQTHADGDINGGRPDGQRVGVVEPVLLQAASLLHDATSINQKTSESGNSTMTGAVMRLGVDAHGVSGSLPSQSTENRVVPSLLTTASVPGGKISPDIAGLVPGANDGALVTEGAGTGLQQSGVLSGSHRGANEALFAGHAQAVRSSVSGQKPVDPMTIQVPVNTEQLTTPAGQSVVTASMASTGLVQGQLLRQRSAAANDDAASQLSRGGNEARLQEINGARSVSALSPASAVAIAPVETKSELVAKTTNAVALAAIREEKSLKAALPVVNQQQMSARIGGVDVSQVGTVDFAPAQIDSAPGSQGVSRIAILEPGWTNQLGSDLRALVTRGTSTTQVQVTPAELGPLDIEVSVNRQELSVRIHALHGQTREMLEAALPRLREFLGQQNYTSVDVSVGSGSGNSSSSSHAHSQQSGGQAGTMAMMSDAQDGLRDSGSAGNTRGAEHEAGSDDLVTEDADPQGNELPSAPTPKPARGLVDAYA